MYQELLTKHRQQISDLEQQQDNRVAETLCDHWKVKDQMLYFVSLHSYVCKCIFCLFFNMFSPETPYLLVKEAWGEH